MAGITAGLLLLVAASDVRAGSAAANDHRRHDQYTADYDHGNDDGLDDDERRHNRSCNDDRRPAAARQGHRHVARVRARLRGCSRRSHPPSGCASCDRADRLSLELPRRRLDRDRRQCRPPIKRLRPRLRAARIGLTLRQDGHCREGHVADRHSAIGRDRCSPRARPADYTNSRQAHLTRPLGLPRRRSPDECACRAPARATCRLARRHRDPRRGRRALDKQGDSSTTSQAQTSCEARAAQSDSAARALPLRLPGLEPAEYIDTYGAFRSDVPGNWHHGDDIFAPLGTPVVAVATGTINRVGWEHLGGWRLWVRDRPATSSTTPTSRATRRAISTRRRSKRGR